MTDPTGTTESPTARPEPPGSLATQRRLWLRGAAVVGGVVVVAGIILIVVSGGNGPKPAATGTGTTGSSSVTAPTVPKVSNAKLVAAGKTAQSVLDTYTSTTKNCAAKTQPTICLEAADRVAGDAIHTYANLLGALSEGAPSKIVTSTLNGAQNLANSFEILGDAEPTKANYNKVLGHFNISFAVTALKVNIGQVDAAHGG
jgi:hypothetical protein